MTQVKTLIIDKGLPVSSREGLSPPTYNNIWWNPLAYGVKEGEVPPTSLSSTSL